MTKKIKNMKNKRKIIITTIIFILFFFMPIFVSQVRAEDLTGKDPSLLVEPEFGDTITINGVTYTAGYTAVDGGMAWTRSDRNYPFSIDINNINGGVEATPMSPSEAERYVPPPAPAPAPAPATKPAPATDHTGQLSWTPNVSIGEYIQDKKVDITPDGNILGNYIAIWYKFLVGIAGLLAMGMLIYGGAGWLMSGGSSAAVGEAKKTISSALIGLTLALLSYTALSFVNPRLLTMKDLSLNTINVSTTDYQMGNVNINLNNGVLPPGAAPTDSEATKDKWLQKGLNLGAQIDANLSKYPLGPNGKAIMQTIAAVEGEKPLLVGENGAAGIFRITPETAKITDPNAFAGMSNVQIQLALQNDDALSTKVEAEYLSGLYNKLPADQRDNPIRYFSSHNFDNANQPLTSLEPRYQTLSGSYYRYYAGQNGIPVPK